MADIKKYELANGVALYHIPDAKYKTVSMSLFLNRPLSRAEATKNALLASVLKRGTNALPEMMQLNRYLEDLYGALYNISVLKKGSVQSIAFEISCLSEQYSEPGIISKCLDLLMGFLYDGKCENGAFLEDYVSTEKVNLKDEIAAIVNDKRVYADFRCVEEMCRDEKCGICELGYADDVDAIDAKSLYQHYQSITHKSPIDLFLVGEVDAEAAAAHLKAEFAKRNLDISPVPMEDAAKPAGEVQTITETMDVSQGKLSMGYRTQIGPNDPRYYALLVGNSILGAGAHSKLFNNVREKHSLCYYVSSRMDKFSSILLIGSGIEPKNYEKALKEIKFQVEAVKKGSYTEAEFQIAKEFIINRYQSYQDSPFLLKDFYLGNCLCGNPDTICDAIQKIKAVTFEDVILAFNQVTLDTIYFLAGKNEA